MDTSQDMNLHEATIDAFRRASLVPGGGGLLQRSNSMGNNWKAVIDRVVTANKEVKYIPRLREIALHGQSQPIHGITQPMAHLYNHLCSYNCENFDLQSVRLRKTPSTPAIPEDEEGPSTRRETLP